MGSTGSQNGRTLRRSALVALVLAALTVAGCASPPPLNPAAPVVPAAGGVSEAFPEPGQGQQPGSETTSEPTSRPESEAATIPIASPAQRWAEQTLASMTLREQVQSLFMFHYPGTSPSVAAEFVERYRPGGFLVMGSNIPNPESDLTKLTSVLHDEANLPLLIAIDQEGGIVRRLKTDETPGAPALRSQNPEATRQAFDKRARLLVGLGINVNFGVVADVTDDPRSYIRNRVLGDTPDEVSTRVREAVAGEIPYLYSTLKHFPGHGEVSVDSHFRIPEADTTLAEWRERAMPPFYAGIAAGAKLVMLNHLTFPQIDDRPASISPTWVRILRQQLGFDGIIITDSMTMLRDSGDPRYKSIAETTVAALSAGVTMVLCVLPTNPAQIGADPDALADAVLDAVESGTLSSNKIADAAQRILLARYALQNG